jgi:hypothetical protein
VATTPITTIHLLRQSEIPTSVAKIRPHTRTLLLCGDAPTSRQHRGKVSARLDYSTQNISPASLARMVRLNWQIPVILQRANVLSANSWTEMNNVRCYPTHHAPLSCPRLPKEGCCRKPAWQQQNIHTNTNPWIYPSLFSPYLPQPPQSVSR